MRPARMLQKNQLQPASYFRIPHIPNKTEERPIPLAHNLTGILWRIAGAALSHTYQVRRSANLACRNRGPIEAHSFLLSQV